MSGSDWGFACGPLQVVVRQHEDGGFLLYVNDGTLDQPERIEWLPVTEWDDAKRRAFEVLVQWILRQSNKTE